MRARFDKGSYAYAFDSLRELGDWIAAAPKTWKGNSSQNNTPSDRWDLNAGYDGALVLARQGWLEGAQRAQNALKSLTPRQPAPRERNDFYGYRPNVPRYCAGAPDNMVRRANDTGAGQALVLYVGISMKGSIHADYVANYGIAVAQYVKQMELEGVRCELHVVTCTELKSVRQSMSVCIKRQGQPLDLAVLAFAIGHPAMLRRIGFAFRERSKGPEKYDYGYPLTPTHSDLINAPDSAVIVTGMTEADRIARTPEQALEALAREIASKTKG